MLVNIARTRREVVVDPALFLAVFIMSGIGDTERSAADSGLVDLDTHKLSLVDERIDVLCALQCVAGVEGFTTCFEPLAGLAGQEVEVEFGACGDHVYVEVQDDRMLSMEFADDNRGQPVTPPRKDDLGPSALRLFTLARDYGHDTVGARLLTMFGRVTCPACSATFRIGD